MEMTAFVDSLHHIKETAANKFTPDFYIYNARNQKIILARSSANLCDSCVVVYTLLLWTLFQDDDISSLYIIQRGHVRLTVADDKLNSYSWDLLGAHTKQVQQSQENGNYVVEIDEGGHFGEWALIGESIKFTAISVGDVVCSTIAKEKFDLIVGSLPKLPQAESMYCTCKIFFTVFLWDISQSLSSSCHNIHADLKVLLSQRCISIVQMRNFPLGGFSYLIW